MPRVESKKNRRKRAVCRCACLFGLLHSSSKRSTILMSKTSQIRSSFFGFWALAHPGDADAADTGRQLQKLLMASRLALPRGKRGSLLLGCLAS